MATVTFMTSNPNALRFLNKSDMGKILSDAKFVKEVTVTDPDSKGEVELSVFKHENGGMFAVDSSYLVQCFDDEVDPGIPDPLQHNGIVVLKGTID